MESSLGRTVLESRGKPFWAKLKCGRARRTILKGKAQEGISGSGKKQTWRPARALGWEGESGQRGGRGLFTHGPSGCDKEFDFLTHSAAAFNRLNWSPKVEWLMQGHRNTVWFGKLDLLASWVSRFCFPELLAASGFHVPQPRPWRWKLTPRCAPCNDNFPPSSFFNILCPS